MVLVENLLEDPVARLPKSRQLAMTLIHSGCPIAGQQTAEELIVNTTYS